MWWKIYLKKSASSYFYLAISVASIILFWQFSLLVLNGFFQNVDHALSAWIEIHRSLTLVPFVVAITDFGGATMITFLTFLIFLFLIYRKASYKILLIIFSVYTSALLTGWLKMITGIARPGAGLMQTSDLSFPSGHTSAATTFFLSALFILWPEIKDKQSRIFFSAATLCMVCAVGVSRIYLGVHWLSDVIGGALLGVAVTSFSIYIYKKVSLIHQFRLDYKSRSFLRNQ